jgi:hypothetical protein
MGATDYNRWKEKKIFNLVKKKMADWSRFSPFTFFKHDWLWHSCQKENPGLLIGLLYKLVPTPLCQLRMRSGTPQIITASKSPHFLLWEYVFLKGQSSESCHLGQVAYSYGLICNMVATSSQLRTAMKTRSKVHKAVLGREWVLCSWELCSLF